MADFEPPSFSLGLDLETQSEPRMPTRSSIDPAHQDSSSDNAGARANSLHEVEQEEVVDSDPDRGPEPTRVLKRLRRGTRPGPTNHWSSASIKAGELEGSSCGGNGDEEIEGFSSQEDLLIRGEHPPAQYNSVCSSSKIPLHGLGVLNAQLSSQRKARKTEQASIAPPSVSLGTSHNGLMFPKLTTSPLRRFQLLDSDSDSDSYHSSIGKDLSRGARKNDPPLKESKSTASEQKRNVSVAKPQNGDLWKDFSPLKNFHIPTPALDEVCEEYLQSVKDKNAASSVGNNKGCHATMNSYENFEQCWDLSDPLPPAHCYFFHDDPRIQKLVRSRLSNFSPLGIIANLGTQQPSASVIDYMSQFSNGQASKQKRTGKINSDKSSTRGINKSNAEGWVDPKSSAAVPKDAGKRRVHASGQSAGHWYTSPEGKKVYISKNGQELSGQIAYRQYRRENGDGCRKSKKKTNSKRKAKTT